MREDYKGLERLAQLERDREGIIESALDKQREEILKKPFNHEDPDKEVANHPAHNVYALDSAQLDDYLKYAERAESIAEYINMNDQQIRAQVSNSDWLHIYSNAINSYDMDM